MPESKSKQAKNSKSRKVQINHRHALLCIGIVLLVWVVLAVAVNNRYQKAKLSVLPKQNDILKLESLHWQSISDDKGEAKPPEGFEYISVTTTLRNISPSPVYLAPVLQSYVKDKVGHIYDIQILVLQNPLSSGQYEPNQQLSGDLGFTVPKNDTSLVWCFESNQGDEQSALCQPLESDNKKP